MHEPMGHIHMMAPEGWKLRKLKLAEQLFLSLNIFPPPPTLTLHSLERLQLDVRAHVDKLGWIGKANLREQRIQLRLLLGAIRLCQHHQIAGSWRRQVVGGKWWLTKVYHQRIKALTLTSREKIGKTLQSDALLNFKELRPKWDCGAQLAIWWWGK